MNADSFTLHLIVIRSSGIFIIIIFFLFDFSPFNKCGPIFNTFTRFTCEWCNQDI